MTVISTSPSKEREARQNLGADRFVVSRDDKQMAVRTLSWLYPFAGTFAVGTQHPFMVKHQARQRLLVLGLACARAP